MTATAKTTIKFTLVQIVTCVHYQLANKAFFRKMNALLTFVQITIEEADSVVNSADVHDMISLLYNMAHLITFEKNKYVVPSTYALLKESSKIISLKKHMDFLKVVKLSRDGIRTVEDMAERLWKKAQELEKKFEDVLHNGPNTISSQFILDLQTLVTKYYNKPTEVLLADMKSDESSVKTYKVYASTLELISSMIRTKMSDMNRDAYMLDKIQEAKKTVKPNVFSLSKSPPAEPQKDSNNDLKELAQKTMNTRSYIPTTNDDDSESTDDEEDLRPVKSKGRSRDIQPTVFEHKSFCSTVEMNQRRLKEEERKRKEPHTKPSSKRVEKLKT